MRCARLKIPCTGSQQRFKFQEPILAPGRTSSTIESGRETPAELIIDVRPKLFLNRSSDSVRLTEALIHRLNIVDVRYDISGYGPVLSAVPSRIGSDEVLDTAVLAFTGILSNLHCPLQPQNALRDFGKAIETLRRCVSNFRTVKMSNILCAVWLIWACEGWLTSHDDWSTGHGIGAMYLLSAIDLDECKDAFDIEVIRSMCGPVLLESMFNHKIKLEPHMSRIVAKLEPAPQDNNHLARLADKDTDPVWFSLDSVSLRNMLNLSNFTHYPALELGQAKTLYLLTQAERRRFDRWSAIGGVVAGNITLKEVANPTPTQRLFTQCQAGKAVLMSLSLMLNTMLQDFYLDDEDLKLEHAELSAQILMLVEMNRALRPLGLRYGTLVLMIVRACSDAVDVQLKAQNILAEQFPSEAVHKWVNGTEWLRSALHSVFLEASSSSASFIDSDR